MGFELLGKGNAALKELHVLNSAAVCLTDVTEWFTRQPWRHFGLLASRTVLPREGRKNDGDLRRAEGRGLTAAITATPVGSEQRLLLLQST